MQRNSKKHRDSDCKEIREQRTRFGMQRNSNNHSKNRSLQNNTETGRESECKELDIKNHETRSANQFNETGRDLERK